MISNLNETYNTKKVNAGYFFGITGIIIKIDNSIDKIESIIQDYFLTSDNAPAAFRYST